MPDALNGLLNSLKRHQEALSASRVTVEALPDTQCPGLTYYLVAGPTEGAVQAFIDRQTWIVEEHPRGGYATFKSPFRVDGGWATHGGVMLYPAQAAA